MLHANPNLNHQTIFGLDPGYDRLGWAICSFQNNQPEAVKWGLIQTDKKKPLFDRYQVLLTELKKIITLYQPSIAAIESLFFFKNQKTALQVAEARGLILSILINHRLKIFEYTPLQIKETVTGYGRADKTSMAKMIKLHFQLKEKKINDDAVDALAIILTHQIRSQNQRYYA